MVKGSVHCPTWQPSRKSETQPTHTDRATYRPKVVGMKGSSSPSSSTSASSSLFHVCTRVHAYAGVVGLAHQVRRKEAGPTDRRFEMRVRRQHDAPKGEIHTDTHTDT